MIFANLVSLDQTANELLIEYAAAEAPGRSDTYSSMIERYSPRNHFPIGTGKPILGRERICSGKTPFMLWRKTYFVVQPRSFKRSGKKR